MVNIPDMRAMRSAIAYVTGRLSSTVGPCSILMVSSITSINVRVSALKQLVTICSTRLSATNCSS